MTDQQRIAEITAHADNFIGGGTEQDWAADIYFLLAEIDRLTEALEAVKRGNVDCASAEHEADGKCLGYGRGENDDEPCEQCANCHKCTAYEAETKTIQEWAALDGIRVYDPDGFDCTDPLLWEREITKAEYVAGIMHCTVLPLPAAPEKGDSRES